MTSSAENTKCKRMRLVRGLLDICVLTRWIFAIMIAFILLNAVLFQGEALRLGGDPADPDAAWPTIQVGVYLTEDFTPAEVMVESLVSAVYYAAGFLILGQMAGILRNVLNNSAFSPDNGDRLRAIGWVGVIAQLGVYALWIASSIIDGTGIADVEGIVMELTPMPWIGVLSAFALSTIFNEGAELKQEQDLTV